MKQPKMYECSLCGKTDKKTYREAREGKLVTICEDCAKKGEFPSGASTLARNRKTGEYEKVDFLGRLLTL